MVKVQGEIFSIKERKLRTWGIRLTTYYPSKERTQWTPEDGLIFEIYSGWVLEMKVMVLGETCWDNEGGYH
jgi:hypothetical protein